MSQYVFLIERKTLIKNSLHINVTMFFFSVYHPGNKHLVDIHLFSRTLDGICVFVSSSSEFTNQSCF
jgi:hypothetical protein